MNECSQSKWDLDILIASTYICAVFTEDLLSIKGRYSEWIFTIDGISFFSIKVIYADMPIEWLSDKSTII